VAEWRTQANPRATQNGRNAVEKTTGDILLAATDLGVAALIARRFRVSLRSAALRLIEARLAGWDRYAAIPPASDQKKRGGRASEPRFRATVRREQFGRRAAGASSAACAGRSIG
jgi:hypothetical protein